MSRGSIIATSTRCLWCNQSLFQWIGGGVYNRIHYPNECSKKPENAPDTKTMRMGVFFDKDDKLINPEDYLKKEPENKTNSGLRNILKTLSAFFIKQAKEIKSLFLYQKPLL